MFPFVKPNELGDFCLWQYAYEEGDHQIGQSTSRIQQRDNLDTFFSNYEHSYFHQKDPNTQEQGFENEINLNHINAHNENQPPSQESLSDYLSQNSKNDYLVVKRFINNNPEVFEKHVKRLLGKKRKPDYGTVTPKDTPVPIIQKRRYSEMIKNDQLGILDAIPKVFEQEHIQNSSENINNEDEEHVSNHERKTVKFFLNEEEIEMWITIVKNTDKKNSYRLHIKGKKFYFIYDSNSFSSRDIVVNWKGISTSSLRNYVGLSNDNIRKIQFSDKENSKILKGDSLRDVENFIRKFNFRKLSKKDLLKKLDELKYLFEIDFIGTYTKEVKMAYKNFLQIIKETNRKYKKERSQVTDHPNITLLKEKMKVVKKSQKTTLEVKKICRGINKEDCLSHTPYFLNDGEKVCPDCLIKEYGRNPYQNVKSGNKWYCTCMGTKNFECREWAKNKRMLPGKEKGGICNSCNKEISAIRVAGHEKKEKEYLKEMSIVWRGNHPNEPRKDFEKGFEKFKWESVIDINEVEMFYVTDLPVCQICESTDCLNIGRHEINGVSVVCCLKEFYSLYDVHPKNWKVEKITKKTDIEFNETRLPNFTAHIPLSDQYQNLPKNLVFLFSRTSSHGTPKKDQIFDDLEGENPEEKLERFHNLKLASGIWTKITNQKDISIVSNKYYVCGKAMSGLTGKRAGTGYYSFDDLVRDVNYFLSLSNSKEAFILMNDPVDFGTYPPMILRDLKLFDYPDRVNFICLSNADPNEPNNIIQCKVNELIDFITYMKITDENGTNNQRFMDLVRSGQEDALRSLGDPTRTQYAKKFTEKWVSDNGKTKSELFEQMKESFLL